MKIVVCAKKDLAGCVALNRLLTGLVARHEVFVVLSDYVLDAECSNAYAASLVAHERGMVLDHILPWLEARFPKGNDAQCQTYLGLQQQHNIRMEQWGPMKSAQSRQRMRELAPDVIISCRYDYVIPQEVIDMPGLGTYGMHPGALPDLQGLCSPFRAMEHGHARSGCTLFHLDAGLDTGPIVEIGWWPIDYGRSLLWNFVHTYFAGIDTLLRHLPALEAGRELTTRRQSTEGRQYFSYPTETEFRSFTQKVAPLVLAEDYYEILSWFLPGGLADPALPELRSLVCSLSGPAGNPLRCTPTSRAASNQNCDCERDMESDLNSGSACIHKNALASA